MAGRIQSRASAVTPRLWVGRESELGALATAASAPGAWVSVVGLGGIGKSALVARHVASVAPSNLVVLDLESEREPLRAIARAVDADWPRAPSERTRAVSAALDASKLSLLVLDGVDGALDGLRALFAGRATPRVGTSVLCAAREPLDVEGESVVALGPLGDGDAARLYGELSRIDAPDVDVRRLAQALEGIPLAIQLAAARASLMGPRELLEKMHDPLRVLRARSATPRHGTMEAVLRESWDALDSNEQATLIALGAFCAPVPLDALESVALAGGAAEPLDAAESLLRKSLAVRHVSEGEVRLGLCALVRAFARARLGERADRARVAEERRAWVLAEVERLGARAYGHGAERALAELSSLAPEAAELFFETERDAPREAVTLALAVADAVLFRQALDLSHPMVEAAVAAAERAGDASLRARARALFARTTLEASDPVQAEALASEAVAIASAAGLPREAADARRTLGWALLALGRLDDAEAALEAAKEALADLASVRGQADAACALGLVRLVAGDKEGAKNAVATSLALHVAAGDEPRRRKVEGIGHLVGLLPDDGDAEVHDRERASLVEALSAHRDRGHSVQEALAAFRLGLLERDTTLAHAWREQARAAAAAAGVPRALIDPIAKAVDVRDAGHGDRRFVVGNDARSLVLPSGEQLDLSRHGSLRRVLDALVEVRLARPGEAMAADALLAAGWPGERVLYDAGQLRVYTAVRRLRKMGLEDVLLTRDDGYLLDPKVAFGRA